MTPVFLSTCVQFIHDPPSQDLIYAVTRIIICKPILCCTDIMYVHACSAYHGHCIQHTSDAERVDAAMQLAVNNSEVTQQDSLLSR